MEDILKYVAEDAPLDAAIRTDNVDGLREIIALAPYKKDARVYRLYPAIQHAIVFGPSTGCLRLLLALGANPDTDGLQMFTALELAAQTDKPEVAGLLIGAGANVNRRHPLLYCTPLHMAVKGSTECTRLLLEAGARPASRNYGGSTPLHLAAANGNIGAVRLLLEAGAPIGAKDANGHTALHIACDNGHHGCVALLAAWTIRKAWRPIFDRRVRAAHRIQASWERCAYDPGFPFCIRRLAHSYAAMQK